MDQGTRILMLISTATVVVTIHLLARYRPGRFLLIRVRDVDRHRDATTRILLVIATAAITAFTTTNLAPDPSTLVPELAVMATLV